MAIDSVLQIDEKQLKKILQAMSDMPDKLAGTALKKANTRAKTPILSAMRKNAPVDKGTLKASLKHKMKSYQRGMVSVAIMGAKRGMGKMVSDWFALTRTRDGDVQQFNLQRKADPSYYLHLVEKGATIRVGGMRGQVAEGRKMRINGTNFMLRSYRQAKGKAEAKLAEALSKHITKTWRTVAK